MRHLEAIVLLLRCGRVSGLPKNFNHEIGKPIDDQWGLRKSLDGIYEADHLGTRFTRSKLPNASRTVASINNPDCLAACWPCSIVNSLPTLPLMGNGEGCPAR